MADYSDITRQIILAVSQRPILWDRTHERYLNIAAVNKEWSELAASLHRDRDFVKKRWRRCRDVFRIELNKFIAPPNATDPMKYYKGSWINFENMLFLKDHIVKRRRCDSEDEALNDTTATGIDFIPKMNNESPKISNESSQNYTLNSPNSVHIEPDEVSMADEQVFIEECNWEIKKEKESWNEEDLDEDINFAKSLVGYLRRLNPVRKMFVRNEIQNLLLKELLCDNCKGTNSECGVK